MAKCRTNVRKSYILFSCFHCNWFIIIARQIPLIMFVNFFVNTFIRLYMMTRAVEGISELDRK